MKSKLDLKWIKKRQKMNSKDLLILTKINGRKHRYLQISLFLSSIIIISVINIIHLDILNNKRFLIFLIMYFINLVMYISVTLSIIVLLDNIHKVLNKEESIIERRLIKKYG